MTDSASNNDNFVIQTNRLTRYFADKCAVDGVTFRVPRGSVTALLGRNGSGKSTLLRMLTGFLDPTRGSATILGHDVRAIPPGVRGRIGYIAENHPLIDWMRVGELERFQSAFYPKTWNHKLFQSVVDHFKLPPRSKARHLSRGERAGVSLALALAPEPELLVMDDPAMGLDPVARRTLLEAMILVTRDSGRTILFSSHLLADVERVADRIAILDRSVMRASCSTDSFLSRIKHYRLRFATPQPPPLPKIQGLLVARQQDNEWRLVVANPDIATEPTLRELAPIAIDELPLTLEDAVIGYLGEQTIQPTLLQEMAVAS